MPYGRGLVCDVDDDGTGGWVGRVDIVAGLDRPRSGLDHGRGLYSVLYSDFVGQSTSPQPTCMYTVQYKQKAILTTPNSPASPHR